MASLRMSFWIPKRKAITFDLVGLSVFIRRHARDKAPFFVGRQAQIDHIENRLEDIIESVRAGDDWPANSASLLIDGAPGVGKISLLDHIKTRRNADSRALRRRTDPSC